MFPIGAGRIQKTISMSDSKVTNLQAVAIPTQIGDVWGFGTYLLVFLRKYPQELPGFPGFVRWYLHNEKPTI